MQSIAKNKYCKHERTISGESTALISASSHTIFGFMTPLPTQSQHPHQDAFSLLQARKIADWSGMSQGKEFSSLQIALRTGIASFLPSVPIFLPEQANDLPKAGIFLIWRGEDWGKGSPHSRILLPCTSQPLHGAFCHYFTSLPSHALGPFTPLSL